MDPEIQIINHQSSEQDFRYKNSDLKHIIFVEV